MNRILTNSNITSCRGRRQVPMAMVVHISANKQFAGSRLELQHRQVDNSRLP